MTLTFREVAEDAVRAYMKERQNGLMPHDAHQAMLDHVSEMTQHHLVIEEPECCDALPQIDWLHADGCPEVEAHHSSHDHLIDDCPVCRVQKRAEES